MKNKNTSDDQKNYLLKDGFITPDGFIYRLKGIELYKNRSGEVVELRHWESHCAECGKPFVCKSPLEPDAIRYMNKRCKEHRRRGVPASKHAAKRKREGKRKGLKKMIEMKRREGEASAG